MLVRYSGYCLLCGALFIAGCSGSTETAPAANSSGSTATTTAAGELPKVNPQSPAECVQMFLAAVKKGDDKTSGALLTTTARQKTSEMNLQVAPPGSDTATFEVGEVELKANEGEEGAYVASKWIDVGEDGKPHTDEIIWMVVKDPEGWRIVGMGVQVFADLDRVFLNFEDPQDMLHKQQLVEQEMMRRASANQPLQGAPGNQSVAVPGAPGAMPPASIAGPTNGQIPPQTPPTATGTPAQAQLPGSTNPLK